MPSESTGTALLGSSGAGRIGWVDLVRGLGIFLVVFGHVLGGLQPNTWFGQSPACTFVIRFIYIFHMPLFFFLAGLFAAQSLARGRSTFLLNKIATIAWPYLIWSVIQGSVQIMLSGLTNNSTGVAELFRIFYHPIGQFWFLYTLFMLHLIYAFLARGSNGTLIFSTFTVLLLGAEYAGYGPRWEMGDAVFHFAIYYAAGTVLGGSGWLRKPPRLRVLLIACPMGYAIVAFGVWAWPVIAFWVYPLLAATGMAATIALGLIIGRSKLGAWVLCLWGRASLEIFLAHTIVAAGCRVLLEKLLHVHEPFSNLIMGISLGIWIPVTLALLAPRLRIEWLFVAPRVRAKTARIAAA